MTIISLGFAKAEISNWRNEGFQALDWHLSDARKMPLPMSSSDIRHRLGRTALPAEGGGGRLHASTLIYIRMRSFTRFCAPGCAQLRVFTHMFLHQLSLPRVSMAALAFGKNPLVFASTAFVMTIGHPELYLRTRVLAHL